MVERESIKEQLEVKFHASMQQRKTKVVSVQVKAPKELFLLPDALVEHGALPSIQEYVAGQIQSLVAEYVTRAHELLSKASEQNKKK
jgi:hypothetical protein